MLRCIATEIQNFTAKSRKRCTFPRIYLAPALCRQSSTTLVADAAQKSLKNAYLGTAPAVAVSASEFAAAMKTVENGLKPRSTIVVAVSGGPDSMALVSLLHRYCKEHNVQLVAATIDHKLRAESSAEALKVHQVLTTLGIQHHIHEIRWDSSKKLEKSRLQAEARERRYAALSALCYAVGARHLFVAHNADDQIETALFRFGRASGIAGLAGISPVKRLLNGLLICRPLLEVPKARLIQTCKESNVEFAVDRSNFNVDFDRVRCRLALQMFQDRDSTGEFVGALAEAVTNFQEVKRDMDEEVNQAIKSSCLVYPNEGVIEWNLSKWMASGLSDASMQSGLSRLLSAAGGKVTSVPSETVATTYSFLRRLLDSSGTTKPSGGNPQHNAHGALIRRVPKHFGGVSGLDSVRVLLHRHFQGVKFHPQRLIPGNPCLFDNRFQVTVLQSAASLPRSRRTPAIGLQLCCTYLSIASWLYLLHLYPELQTQITAPPHILQTLPVVVSCDMRSGTSSEGDANIEVDERAFPRTGERMDPAALLPAVAESAMPQAFPITDLDEKVMMRTAYRIPPDRLLRESRHTFSHVHALRPLSAVWQGDAFCGFRKPILPAAAWKNAVHHSGWWSPSCQGEPVAIDAYVGIAVNGKKRESFHLDGKSKTAAENVVMIPNAKMTLIKGVWADARCALAEHLLSYPV